MYAVSKLVTCWAYVGGVYWLKSPKLNALQCKQNNMIKFNGTRPENQTPYK